MKDPISREQILHQQLRRAHQRAMSPRPSEYFIENPNWMNDPEDRADFEWAIDELDKKLANAFPPPPPITGEDLALIINARS